MSDKEKEDRMNRVQNSFFLYDKSKIIKKIFITELKKYIVLYGIIPYFAEKEEKHAINTANPKQSVPFLSM